MNPNKAQRSAVALIEISDAQRNQRLDNFLINRLSDIPKTRVYRIIRKGEVRVNKKRCKPEYKLQPGDQVRIPPLTVYAEPKRKPEPPVSLVDNLERAILFENRHLIIIDKPPSLAVHAGSGVSYGLIDAMRIARAGDQIELVHRLDRDTSGCLMIAKDRPALLALQNLVKQRSCQKYYQAVVMGAWPEGLREISHRLKKFHLPNGERRVRADPGGQSSCSRIRLLRCGRQYSLIEIELVTGRTHQIRVHCQTENHPIAGDDKYGDAEFNRSMRKRGIRRLMLHANRLELPKSDYNPELLINAPLPGEFEMLNANPHL